MEVRCKGKVLPTCLGTYQTHELGLGDLSRGLRRDDGGSLVRYKSKRRISYLGYWCVCFCPVHSPLCHRLCPIIVRGGCMNKTYGKTGKSCIRNEGEV